MTLIFLNLYLLLLFLFVLFISEKKTVLSADFYLCSTFNLSVKTMDYVFNIWLHCIIYVHAQLALKQIHTYFHKDLYWHKDKTQSKRYLKELQGLNIYFQSLFRQLYEVCECIATVYTPINSEKNVFNTIVLFIVWCNQFCLEYQKLLFTPIIRFSIIFSSKIRVCFRQ